ncbi:unnamed protein product [Meganyctiphanes norvegica]|uniref:PI-PLC X domain-containing protein 1 n=1 Tax=Meganyctiphanes norvegica TaxID=48144 RepID=A0AAV2S696_MEGNR
MGRHRSTTVLLIFLGIISNSYGLPHIRNVSSAIPANTKDCSIASSGAYIAISSEAEAIDDSHFLRWIEVKWFGLTELQEDYSVGLWTDNPSIDIPPISWIHVESESGSLRTTERWDGSLLPNKTNPIGMGNYCLPYWAGVSKGGVIVYTSCLRLNPFWLSELSGDELGSVKLADVLLPGTHDAGASGKFGLSILGEVVGRWTFTQDESLWEQLILGSRYLDIRISYYNNTQEKFFINHADIRIAPLIDYVHDVAAFMRSTMEIVIFDIHRLPVGFDHPDRYLELINFLYLHLGRWMTPRSLYPNPTLGEIWDSGRRLIVTFPSGYASDHPYLWNQVHHAWPNTNNLDDLKSRLDNFISDNSGSTSLWSAMAEFTPSALDVAVDHWHGLRGAAEITNLPVTKWLRESWWKMANIVAMDYLPASGVVEAAIEANMARLSC